MDSESALKKLMDGNERFLSDVPPPLSDFRLRRDTAANGQHPYAAIVTCSDSRVVPEIVFNTGIGELFVIRTAGNTIFDGELGSIDYAVSHLGCGIVVVMAHTHCGAVHAALNGHNHGHVGAIVDRISESIGDEEDPTEVSVQNARNSASTIKESIPEATVVVALYDIESGRVTLQ